MNLAAVELNQLLHFLCVSSLLISYSILGMSYVKIPNKIDIWRIRIYIQGLFYKKAPHKWCGRSPVRRRVWSISDYLKELSEYPFIVCVY